MYLLYLFQTDAKSELESCKIFVGGLNLETTQDGLKAHFEKWGEVVDCVVVKDPHTKRSRGFGFVTYKRAHMASAAHNAKRHMIDKREVELKSAVRREVMCFLYPILCANCTLYTSVPKIGTRQ